MAVKSEPTVGAEMRKTRPVVIVSDDSIGFLPLKFIVPVTDWKDTYNQVVWMTKIEPDASNGLSKVSAADAFQVRNVSQQRFVKKLGELTTDQMREIEKALAVTLKIQTSNFRQPPVRTSDP